MHIPYALQSNQPLNVLLTYFFFWQQIPPSRVRSPHKLVIHRSYTKSMVRFPNYLSLRKIAIFLVRLSFFSRLKKCLKERPETFNEPPEGFLLKHESMVYVMVRYSGSLHVSKRTSCFICRSSHKLRSQEFSG